MIHVDDVSYQVGQAQLLQRVSFTAEAGQVVAIVGANGAGKTTLLRLVSGELSPSGGRILFHDRDLSTMPSAALARKRAVLSQSHTLGFSFTVTEVIMLGRTPYFRDRLANEAVTLEAMAAASVDHLSQRHYPTLSGGERQRVHFARILAQLWEAPGQCQGKLLLLDEPTANLDLAHRQSVLGMARRCAETGATVLAVLHDLNLAAQYADAILVLCRGRQCAFGTPKQVLTREVIRATFGLDVVIGSHPCAPCPLVLSVPPARKPAYSPTLADHHDPQATESGAR